MSEIFHKLPHIMTRLSRAFVMVMTAIAIFDSSAIANDVKENPVTVTIGQHHKDIDRSYFGYNSALVLSNLTWSGETAKNVANYCPGMLRFPGGTVGDYWDWSAGGVRPSAPGSYAKCVSAPRVWLSDFLRNGIGRTGATPIFMLNMLTSKIDYQIGMLAKCRELGVRPRYAELGNEFYYQPFSYKFTSPKVYACEAEYWAQQIKANFPAIKLGVVTSETDWGPGGWNETAAREVPDADAIIQHLYTPTGIGTDKVTGANIDTYLSAPVTSIQATMSKADRLAKATGKEIWVTEFNCYDWASHGGNEERRSWAHGLYVAEMAEQIGLDKYVTHMLVHQITATTPGGAAYISTTNEPTATGLALQWLGWAASGAHSADDLSFSSNPTLIGHSSFVGTLFSGANGRSAFILNLSKHSKLMDVASIWKSGCNFRQRYAPVNTDVTGSSSVSELHGFTQGQVTLPPYSVSLLSEK